MPASGDWTTHELMRIKRYCELFKMKPNLFYSKNSCYLKRSVEVYAKFLREPPYASEHALLSPFVLENNPGKTKTNFCRKQKADRANLAAADKTICFAGFWHSYKSRRTTLWLKSGGPTTSLPWTSHFLINLFSLHPESPSANWNNMKPNRKGCEEVENCIGFSWRKMVENEKFKGEKGENCESK